MEHRITVLPEQTQLIAKTGDNLMTVLRSAGLAPAAPCGGNGTCGKCKVTVDGREVLACQSTVCRDMTVTLPRENGAVILTEGIAAQMQPDSGLALAIDIGTTTVAAYLMEDGQILATESRKNPQAAYGADVVSRIHYARSTDGQPLTGAIRRRAEEMTEALLARTGKSGINTVCVVGNPAMQQLFLGLSVENLTTPPFLPLLKKAKIDNGGSYIPMWKGADLLLVPDIAGYIGADTVAGILATGMDKTEKLTLLVDIGTNGEMVLGNKDGLVACATAAGPALEGAGIKCGMLASCGAIDRVGEDFSCHVIGEGNAMGICGSGLLDAAAVALHKGILNERGRILNEDRTISLADGVQLCQEDIRQLQLAKGAIAAGIALMAEHLGVAISDIERVYLAGAFGTFLDPRSACRIGLIPAELEEKIQPVGNAAGSGAVQMSCSREAFARADAIVSKVTHLELAALPQWAKCFARHMRFENEADYWCKKAQGLGFSYAAPLDVKTLIARQDVRRMCAADQCGAYGKNWTCPPHCGTLEECAAQMQSHRCGILLQTVGVLQKTIDTKAYRETEKRHLQQLYALAQQVKSRHPGALCLGSGGCRVCKRCAWPEPCRFPEKACASMEAYGLFVTDVCRGNGLAYHHGEKTVTYTGCVLF